MKNTPFARPFLVFPVVHCLFLIAGLGLTACGNEKAKPPGEPIETTVAPPDTLLTCRICGYRTLTSDSATCPICYVQLSPAEVIAWGYRSMEEMIREEQAMFFAAEGFREKDFFSEPRSWKTEGAVYQKDTAWEPQITEGFVLEMRDTLIKAGVIE